MGGGREESCITAADNVALARDFFERVWKQRDDDAFERTSSPDCLFHDPLKGDLDKDEMKQLMKRFDSAFRLTDATLDEVISAGDDVVFRFQDGRLAEQWSAWNTLGFLQQVGALPDVTPAERAPRPAEVTQQRVQS